MKSMISKISNLITALVMFAAAAMPFRLAAQVGNPVEEKQLHYRVTTTTGLGGHSHIRVWHQ